MQYLLIRLLIAAVCLFLAAKEDYKTGEVSDWKWMVMLGAGLLLGIADAEALIACLPDVFIVALTLFIIMELGYIGDADWFLLYSLQVLVPFVSNGMPLAFVVFALGAGLAWLHKRGKEVRLVPYLLVAYLIAVVLG